ISGKSPLFKRLTPAQVLPAGMVFATLGPTMRQLEPPSGDPVILSDTAGFIADLPVNLVAAFRATLEEVISADVIVHVRDVSAPEHEAQKDSVDSILEDLGLSKHDSTCPIIEVFNKIDLLSQEEREQLQEQVGRQDLAVAASAL